MYDATLWQEWLDHELKNYQEIPNKASSIPKKKYLKKGYTHFDNRFWLPHRSQELKALLQQGLRYFNTVNQRTEYWSFSPFIKVLIKTPRYKSDENGEGEMSIKIRPICYAAHIDSLIFGYYAWAIQKFYESHITSRGFDSAILAYRPSLGKCNIQFAKEAFDFIRSKGECTAIALDIKGYFDSIDHKILKQKWIKVIGEKLPDDQYKIYHALTRYSYVVKSSLLKHFKDRTKRNEPGPANLLGLKGLVNLTTSAAFGIMRNEGLIVTNNHPDKKTGRLKGIPQGSSISSLLSNIYLIDFDEMMFKKAQQDGFLYVRYCDDILLVCNNNSTQSLKNFVIDTLENEYYLNIQDKKLEIIRFGYNSKGKIRGFNQKKQQALPSLSEENLYKPLQYLGFEFNGQNVFIRGSSLSRYFRKTKDKISRTIERAYGKNGVGDVVRIQKLLHSSTHLGKMNFIRYAYNASKEFYFNHEKKALVGFNSPTIKRQLSKHMHHLIRTLNIKNNQRFNLKVKTVGQTLKKRV